MVLVNLAELPLEILEKIISELEPDEVSSPVSQISRKFAEVSYNVMCSKFRELQSPILQRLSESKENLKRLSDSPTSFENEMLQVSNFTFYQILHSEYRILCAVYFNRKSVEHSALVFRGVRSLKEFNKLLFGHPSNFQDDNVSSLLDTLRNCNSELLELFFRQVWNVEQDYLGLLVLRLLNCSVCSKYDVQVIHELFPKGRNTKCQITGKYEIADLSNTLSSPPDGLQELSSDKAKKIFASYVCDAIRWGNLFHTLRLRWICMDKALAIGRRQAPGWPRMNPRHPYDTTDDEEMKVDESQRTTDQGEYKVIRRLTKTNKMAPTSKVCWMGTSVELRLSCKAEDVPEEMLSDEYRMSIHNLPGEADDGNDNVTSHYQFKLKYHANVRSLANSNQGLVKTTVIVKETPDFSNIRQLKTFVPS